MGVATFQFVERTGLKTLAGVFAASPMASAVIPVDNDDTQGRFTGFAVANPSDVDINLQLAIYKTDGTQLDQVRPGPLNPLVAYGQIAVFLHQYSNSVLKFRGTMRITADSGQTFVMVALQQAQELVTAIPVISGR
jgi:hypothetical protein